MLEAVTQTQSHADSEATIKTYNSMMRQLESFLGRNVYKSEYIHTDGNTGTIHAMNDIQAVTMDELLLFLANKRSVNAKLSKTTAQLFKSAVKSSEHVMDVFSLVTARKLNLDGI